MRSFRPRALATIVGALLVVACQGAPAPTTAPATAPATPAVASPAAASSPAAALAPSQPAAVPPMMLGASPPPMMAAASPAAASSSPGACGMSLAFMTLRDLVGASTVGACLENERLIAGNGNVEQRTTGGTLTYRALDGRLLFVGTSQTWINRDGALLTPLLTRPNDERFEWEGDRQLVESIRQGGYTVYFRHGPTDSSQRDTEPNNLANCATQRNLTEAGRQQARAIGEALRALKIPDGDVRTSEYCRAREYARLLFERDAQVEPGLVLPDPLPEEQRARNTESLKTLLSLAPPSGANRFLVAHSPNIKLAAGVDLPEEGGAAVFRLEAGTPKLVARIVPAEWPAWARALSAR